MLIMTLQVLVRFHRQKRDAVTRVDAHRPGGQQECMCYDFSLFLTPTRYRTDS